MKRAAQRLRKIRELERKLAYAEYQWEQWYKCAKSASITVKKAKRMLMKIDHRLTNGKQRDR